MHDLEKENRPPRGMASATKKKGSTPGRPRRTGNQFWDIGKVGRKTGITLEDKGIRDEHGLEPVEHIFSSPVSPQRREMERTLTSSDMHGQESSGPDLDKTLEWRKTPRLPPPRTSTPKHTNIGSPKRMSTGRPTSQGISLLDGSPSRPRTLPPNRVINFGKDAVHESIESHSPFKPKNALRRSMAGQNPFASPVKAVPEVAELEDAEDDVQIPVDDGPIILDDDNYFDAPQTPDAEEIDAPTVQDSPLAANLSSGKKRDRSALEEDQAEDDSNVSQSQIDQSGRAQKKQKGKNKVVVHYEEGDEAIDPALLAYGDEYVVEEDAEVAPEPSKKGKGKGKKTKAPKERDANKATRAPGSPVKLNDSPSKLRNSQPNSRAGSIGPMPNYTLRATTPFEDAGSRISRYGRNLIQPLKFWANEGRTWKHGEIDAIVRADEVEVPKRKVKKRGKKARKGKHDLTDIAEESESESVAADEWEEDVGVIAGHVANWDAATQAGNPDDLIKEDLAFASSSIVTRDVANSEFKYAKIMTLPFFGSGVVEIPPEGYKRPKNSRKMHMCFFVHEGKVMVEVGAAGSSETNQFAISKGGVFVVPRGNNYAITNESRTKSARVFFAQGNEVDAALAKSR